MNGKIYFRGFLNFISFISLLAIEAFIGLDYFFNIFEFSINQLVFLTIGVIILSYVKLFTTPNYQKMGFHMIILTYTFLVHFGFLIANYIDPVNSIFRSEKSLMFRYMSEYSVAIEVSIFVCVIYVLSVNSKLLTNLKLKNLKKTNDFLYDKLASNLFFIGMAIQFIGVVLIIYIFFKCRNLTYLQMIDFTSSLWWYGHLTVLLSYAMCMIVACCDYSKWKYGVILYGIIALINFRLGNRGEVLYSTITCLAVYYLKYKKLNKRSLIIGATILILLIPVVRNFRVTLSLDSYTLNIKSSIIQTLSELGFQIAPLTYTIDIVNSEGYRFGGTYMYNIIDFILRRIPFISNVDIESFYNIKYLMPYDGLGYSQIAEAYINFGILGASIVFFLFSRLVIFLEKLFINSNSIYIKIFSSLIIVEFMNLTRNSFSTFPVYVSYIFVIMFFVWILSIAKVNKRRIVQGDE